MSKRYIIDSFIYFNEKEIMELRIKILNNYVDKFIICESNKTHSGKPREFEVKKLIKELNLPAEKIEVIELEYPEDDDLYAMQIDYRNCYDGNHTNLNSVRGRIRERLQRDELVNHLDKYDNDTFIINGDCDEIVNPKYIDSLVHVASQIRDIIMLVPMVYLQGRGDLRVFQKQTGFPEPWNVQTFFCRKEHMYYVRPTQIRSSQFNGIQTQWLCYDNKIVEDIGWHFSWMGDNNRKLIKRESFIHYDDKFSFIEDGYYGSETKIKKLQEGMREGMTSYNSTECILKKYPISNLPKEIFESKKMMEFFFPT